MQTSVRFLKHHHICPIGESETEVTLLVADPADRFPMQALELATGRKVQLNIGMRSEIDDLIERYYGSGRSAMGTIVENLTDDNNRSEDDIEHLRDLASEAPVIRLVNLIIQRAVEQRASDIHIEPFENRLKVRYRIDGVLHEVESPPQRLDRGGDLAHQDHGQAQHRRAPPAAGRPHHAARAGQGDRPSRVDACRPRTANRW